MDALAPHARRSAFAPPVPWLIDVGASAALTVGALVALAGLRYSGPVALAVVGCAGTTTAVAYRRVAPVTATLVAVTALAAYQRVTHDPLGTFVVAAMVLTSYMLGRRSGATHLVLAGALVYAFAATAVANGSGAAVLGAPTPWLPLVCAPMIVGVVVARRDRLASELEVTLDALRSEQDARAVQAVAEERNRIARELHDVVAHDVSVMVIQAGAARMVVADDPIAARQALGVVEDSGRDAIGELRRLMGVLRRDDDLVGAGAGLARVDALVARVRAAGIDTVLHIDTAIPALAPALDLVAYRVVQEALTNVVKHGGAGARAEVRIRSDNGAVAIEVQNAPGVRRDHGVAAAGGGHGLAGMRERVALYGGRLDVGSDATGAFCVRACLPATRTAPVEPVPRVPIVAPPMPAPDQLTARPDRRADVVIAVAWLALLEIEVAASAHRRGPLWANALAVGAMAIAAVWRRRAPLLFLLFVGAIAVVLGSGLTSMQYGTLTGTYTLVVPLFAVAAWSTRGRATIGLVAWLTGATAGAVLWHAPVGGWLGATVMGCVIWMVGRITRGQRSLTVRLRSASALLEAERDVREELAVTRERGRIARDLDALVSYDVVAMIVQAEAARALLDRHPDRAADAAHAVEQAGREALGRMRDVLGVLRADDAPALRSPVVSAGELDGALA